MNPSDLENELRSLKPAAPRAELRDAVAREMKQVGTTATSGVLNREKSSVGTKLLNGLCWAFGGAAIAVIVTVCINVAGTTPRRANELAVVPPGRIDRTVFEPVETSRELVGTEESDVIYAENEAPARIMTYRSRERQVWSNPATGARVEVEVPRQDVMLVPVSFQ